MLFCVNSFEMGSHVTKDRFVNCILQDVLLAKCQQWAGLLKWWWSNAMVFQMALFVPQEVSILTLRAWNLSFCEASLFSEPSGGFQLEVKGRPTSYNTALVKSFCLYGWFYDCFMTLQLGLNCIMWNTFQNKIRTAVSFGLHPKNTCLFSTATWGPHQGRCLWFVGIPWADVAQQWEIPLGCHYGVSV